MLISGTILEERLDAAALEARLEHFSSLRTRQLLTWWLRAEGGGVPQRRSFDIVEHGGLINFLILAERVDSATFYLKIVGPEADEMIGLGMEGRVLTTRSPNRVHRSLALYYQTVAEARRPLSSRGVVRYAARSIRRIETVDCPLSSDGESVTAILSVLDFVSP